MYLGYFSPESLCFVFIPQTEKEMTLVLIELLEGFIAHLEKFSRNFFKFGVCNPC